jgi:cytochrome c1
MMTIVMRRAEATQRFGAAPPDLTVSARALDRGLFRR